MSTSRKTAAEEFEKQSSAVQKIQKDLLPYTNGQPYDEGRLLSEIDIYCQQHANSGFEIGRRLIVLKAQTEHGRFVEICKDRFHIGDSQRKSLMTFARICVEAQAISKGMIDFDKLKLMDRQKVKLLGDVIPQYADELTESGTIKGRTLDEWDTKSREELRKELKSKEQQIEKLKTNAEAGIEKRQQLQDELDALKSHQPDEVSKVITRISKALNDCLTDFDNNAKSKKALPEATRISLVALKQNVRAFAARLCDMADERFDIIELEEAAAFEADEPANRKTATVKSILKNPAQYKGNGKKPH